MASCSCACFEYDHPRSNITRGWGTVQLDGKPVSAGLITYSTEGKEQRWESCKDETIACRDIHSASSATFFFYVVGLIGGLLFLWRLVSLQIIAYEYYSVPVRRGIFISSCLHFFVYFLGLVIWRGSVYDKYGKQYPEGSCYGIGVWVTISAVLTMLYELLMWFVAHRSFESVIHTVTPLADSTKDHSVASQANFVPPMEAAVPDPHPPIKYKAKATTHHAKPPSAVPLFPDEEQHLEGSAVQIYCLIPSKVYREDDISDRHFRTAESQVYRLAGEELAGLKIEQVDYVVNPVLTRKWNRIKAQSGEFGDVILGFHGTDQSNIDNICQENFSMSHLGEGSGDKGWYGRGIYFSSYPGVAAQYMRGANKLLLCQLIPGRVFKASRHDGQPLKAGYDSHVSEDGTETVIFDVNRILPTYVVHFTWGHA